MRPPLRMRVLWFLMVRSEHFAQWCRFRWLRWHEGKGVIVPGDDDETPRR